MGEDGTAEGTWADDHGLDEGTAKAVGKFDGVPSLAKGYAELQGVMASSTRFPADNASDEDRTAGMAKVYGKLGVPKTVDGYDFQVPAELPQGVQWDAGIAETFKTFCLENHIPKETAGKLLGFQMEHTTARAVASQAQVDKAAQEASEALKAKVGADKYDNFLADAQKGFSLAAERVPGFLEWAEASGAGNATEMAELMHFVFKDQIEEGSAVSGDGSATKAEDKGPFAYPSMDEPQ